MNSVYDLPLDAVGLGSGVRFILYGVSLLPLVGLVIGGNYSFRKNAATRQFGRRLFLYAVLLHGFYLMCLCPAAMALALNQ
ncbi:MAG: hypothetical protein K8I82_10265 [Anaerolineae bacterium]|nr:hypothetical protein [Anaerolineae bacterium]